MKFKIESQLHFQRLVLGIICGLLPICCILFGLLGQETNPSNWWHSISATYYANSKMWMIGSLVLASFFFATYKGYDLGDRVFTTVSAISSIGVVVFPMEAEATHVGLFMLPSRLSHILHCVFASILFISFALMILTQFTKGCDKSRNRVYYICGSIIVVFIMSQVVTSFFHIGWMTIINEFVMLEAFAVAWIVKSKAIFLLKK